MSSLETTDDMPEITHGAPGTTDARKSKKRKMFPRYALNDFV